MQAYARDGQLPLSFAQQRLWFLYQLEPNSSAYNILEALRLLGQLNLTALEQSFISKKDSARLDKTGDLTRYLPDGNIEFLNRIDQQVKIRGFRIELGDIEAALGQHPQVLSVVVIAREDIPGDKRLVAYLVLNQQLTPTISEWREFLMRKLPGYMIPSAFVYLDSLPLV